MCYLCVSVCVCVWVGVLYVCICVCMCVCVCCMCGWVGVVHNVNVHILAHFKFVPNVCSLLENVHV